ncbi:MAG: hypothetical protein K6E38_00975 [Fretibacterium sp.]|nr:hypothetical protein [Fretibacterium sp.]
MRRPGMSLCMTLIFSIVTALFLGNILSRLWWAREVSNAEEHRVRNGAALASLTTLGQSWIQAETLAGRLPRKVRAVPEVFEEVLLFRRTEEEGTVEIYDLDYDPEKVPDSSWNFPGFFPPCPGALLIRASVTGEGMERRTETVTAVRELEGGGAVPVERPLMQQEFWP